MRYIGTVFMAKDIAHKGRAKPLLYWFEMYYGN